MKSKPVRICDVSRVLRISSASLISFLKEKGFTLKGDFRSPLSGKMVELIQNGYQEGPPFTKLNPLIPKAEAWETENTDIVNQLHTPTQRAEPQSNEPQPATRRRGRPRKPRLQIQTAQVTIVNTGKITLSYIDLELIQKTLALQEPEKIKVRDYLRRRTILKALAKFES
jgi:hypothetical protein